MNRQEAEKIVREYLDSRFDGTTEVVIVSDETIEREYGWIFQFQSKQFLEGKTRHFLIGYGPILIEKSGELVVFPSSITVEESIRRYEAGEPLVRRPKRSQE